MSVLVFDAVNYNGVCIKVKKTGTISKGCDFYVKIMLSISLRRSHVLVVFYSNLCMQHLHKPNPNARPKRYLMASWLKEIYTTHQHIIPKHYQNFRSLYVPYLLRLSHCSDLSRRRPGRRPGPQKLQNSKNNLQNCFWES